MDDVKIKIKKRNGRKVLFRPEKIAKAIQKAFNAIDGEITEEAKTISEQIASNIFLSAQKNPEIMSVEDIQDMVEDSLMNSSRKDVARAYIIYRAARAEERAKHDAISKAIAEKLTASNVENQNANIDEHSFGGRMGEARSVVTKNFALENIISQMARDNHENNEVYIHDLDSYAVGEHNCLSIPFDKLLANGFNTRQTDVRPPRSINTAMQLVAVLFQLQSLQQFGGVSATHLDWTMVPFVRISFMKHYKDGLFWVSEMNPANIHFNENASIDDRIQYPDEKAYKYAMAMTKKETKQAVEALYHNLNTLQSRSGNQLPFSSINYGTCTLPEGRMVTQYLLEVSIDGLGKMHRTSIFPCGIFQMMSGVNRKPGDPNYDLFQLALRSTAQRLYPNYANCDWSGNAGYDINDPKTYFSTMGKCKLQLM